MFNKNISPLHQKLVRALVNAFIEQQGYKIISAAIEEYPDPEKVGRHEPDVIAKDSYGIWQIGEAKTGDGDLNDHTKEQFLDYSKYSFHVIVPENKKEELERFLEELGIIGKVTIWTLP